MIERTLEESKKWYIDAVRSVLILNYGIMENEADEAIRKYSLKEALDEYPYIQMHYDVRAVADEMLELGYFRPII